MTTRRRVVWMSVTVMSLMRLGSVAMAKPALSAAEHHQSDPAVDCVALPQLDLPDMVITSAAEIPADSSVPSYCRVFATVAPETDIEVRLPHPWQRRLLHLGGSGPDGVIPNLDPHGGRLQQGYALVASNGGHRDPTGGFTRFLDNPTIIEDYAHAAIAKTVNAAKAIVRAYYRRRPRRTYFQGCSAGGRGALNAAAKYGHEYDGVVAGAPTRNWSGLLSGWAIAGQQSAPSPAKLSSMYEAQVAHCDAADGLADGLIGNPAACDFDPATLRCAEGVDGDSCLTDAEVQAVNTIRSDVKLASGRTVYSRLGIGNPATGFGVFMPLGPPGSPTVASFLSAGFLPYIVFSDPSYDAASYDVDRDLPTLVNVNEGLYDFSADTAPLARYLRSGGKMLVWHGAEDTTMSHLDTIRSYEKMADAAGRRAANARLYTPAGVQHCGGGPGADGFDMLEVLANWVEKGHAPGRLTASKFDAAGNVLFTRPLCEHPRYARYIGHGDPNDASSFRCVRP